MDTGQIDRRLADGVLHLVIDRPAKRNALSAAMYRELTAALQGADGDPAVRVVLIAGRGGHFTAGNDLGDFLHRRAGDDSPAMAFLQTLAAFGKPVVVAVDGDAVGIGTTLLLHCDLILATPGARFRLPFVDLALCPEAASSLLLPQLAGYHRAAALLLLGDVFDADSAREAGLVHRIVPAEALAAEAAALAARLAAKPADSLRVTKLLLKDGQRAAVSATMARELAQFSRLVAAPAAKERFAAFLAKRRGSATADVTPGTGPGACT